MTQFEVWTIVISSVSAVITLSAVIVALWLGVWQSRKQYKRSLGIGFRNNANIEIDGKDTHCLEIIIYNIGNTVCAIENILLNKYFALIPHEQEPLFLKPQMIGIGETITFDCRFDCFIDAIKSGLKKKRIKETSSLVLYIMDITGKSFKFKIENTAGEYLAWDRGEISLYPIITE